jgi:uncharacterized membrane protein YgdD (TMEM256/DUF423 family)
VVGVCIVIVIAEYTPISDIWSHITSALTGLAGAGIGAWAALTASEQASQRAAKTAVDAARFAQQYERKAEVSVTLYGLLRRCTKSRGLALEVGVLF